MAHLILVFVFGMVVLRQESAKEAAATMSGELGSNVPDLKLDEKPEPPSDEQKRTAVPQIDEATPTQASDYFLSPTDQTLNTEAIKDGTREMMGFETLTLVPFDRRLIDAKQLLPFEIAWVNAYHARVRREIEPILLSDDRAWLRHATAPIG